MNISNSYSAFNSNANLPLKSGHSVDSKLNVSNTVESTPDLSAISSSISSEITPSVVMPNVGQSTYTKPALVPSQVTPDNTKTIETSIDTSGSVNNTDEASGDSEGNRNTNPSNAQSSSQTEHNDHSHSGYSENELALIDSLQLRDTEVEAHERAHAAVGGQHAGSPSYSYKTGPDGVKYAVSGEVSIDTSPVSGDPQATLQKAQQIKAAALAPAEPSGQDRKVAAKADQMATQARNELLAENSNSEGSSEGNKTTSRSIYDSSVPEHFNGQENLSVNDSMDNATQIEMHDRNMHINALYQNSTKTSVASGFNVLA
tara:strand:- start:13429 stop:14376 length:948 start_codon:yes stop_codon:yes gene_type:complete